MDIDKLIPAVGGLRDPAQIENMVRFVQSGGRFSQTMLRKHNLDRTTLIVLTRFEDGKLYIRDGIHRIFSIWMAGRASLFSSEYDVEEMTYDLYLRINFEKGWVTPFDPRTHVRLADFWDFKRQVMDLWKQGKEDDAKLYISRHSDQYCIPRTEEHNHISHMKYPEVGVV